MLVAEAVCVSAVHASNERVVAGGRRSLVDLVGIRGGLDLEIVVLAVCKLRDMLEGREN
jgi:hypothetical protein